MVPRVFSKNASKLEIDAYHGMQLQSAFFCRSAQKIAASNYILQIVSIEQQQQQQ